MADVRIVEEPPRSDVWRDPQTVLDGMATLLDLSTEAQRAQLAILLRERIVAPRDGVIAPRNRVAVVAWTPPFGVGRRPGGIRWGGWPVGSRTAGSRRRAGP
ncbi:hypothetical protein [Sulfobacillus harzensis]|uniref:Uncharacterized protein n=1 Tax=Sulfobacillus harzensis TaxID=2729629 RepID=A0A7Y0L201_9FIRM|nr:hypothetical protein [Sulfobacillus harzensis]NMP21562.1 hypothetical protein [Sulfobacillus harzensis]